MCVWRAAVGCVCGFMLLGVCVCIPSSEIERVFTKKERQNEEKLHKLFIQKRGGEGISEILIPRPFACV